MSDGLIELNRLLLVLGSLSALEILGGSNSADLLGPRIAIE